MIIDGKAIANQIQQEIKELLSSIPGRRPCLAVILAGDHLPSQLYVKRKREACEKVGIQSIRIDLAKDTTEDELSKEIKRLNDDDTIDGILIQLPLPPHINPLKILSQIAPNKDVDGLHPLNAGKLLLGEEGFVPCTPLGIKVLLQRTGIDVSGKHAVVLGRSNLVGKPMAALLMQNRDGGNATVTVAHSKTKNLKSLCQSADILIAAMGSPKFITADMVKSGAVVIDVGINKVEGSQIVGDVDFENVKDLCSWITPVPGGVGPMTIAMLLSNTVKAYLNRSKSA